MWGSARSVAPGGAHAPRLGAPADDAALVLQAGAPFASLARLTLGVAPGGALRAADLASATRPPGAAGKAPECEEGVAEGLAGAARAAGLAAALRVAVPEVRDWCLARPQQAGAADTLQLLCPKVRARSGAWLCERACADTACQPGPARAASAAAARCGVWHCAHALLSTHTRVACLRTCRPTWGVCTRPL